MSKILITGGTGFFGKSILSYIDDTSINAQVTIVSRNTIDLQGLYKNVTIDHICSDIRELKLDSDYDYIIHAATPASMMIQDSEMKSIIEDGMMNMIEQAQRCNCKKFLFTSSGAVYGNMSRPATEEDDCNPITQYGKSKLIAEQALLDSEIDSNIARCFAFSGKHLNQNIHYAIGNFIKNARDNSDIMINGDGKSIRSYLDQSDLAAHLMKILFNGKDKQTYNVGSDKQISILDLALLVKSLVNDKISVKVLNKKESIHKKDFYVPNIQKIQHDLGCQQKVSLQESIMQMYNICI